MKPIITTLLVFIVLISFGQNKKIEAPKKANTIIILKKGNAEQILIEFAQHLQDNGYSIEKLDKDLLSLSTDFKEYKFSGIAVLKIFAFVRQLENNVKIEIKGKIEVSNPFGGQIPYDACNCGLSGDARKNAFKTILTLLETYSYENIEFLEK
ncbi:MAG TPA: hypothetical protein PL153_02665 [Tenuifilum sp.]|nr:hypothetical protein [Tenuifilum sp.]